MPRTFRRPVLAVALAAGAVLAGALACGTSGSGSSGSALAQAMDRVSGSGPATVDFEFGDLAALRRAGVVHADQVRDGGKPVEPRWYNVVGVGAASLSSYLGPLTTETGVNFLAADTATTIGQPPHTAVRLDGSFDTKGISRKLTALGAKRRTFDGTDGLSFGADYSVNTDSELTRTLMLTSQLDQVLLTKDHVIVSPSAKDLGEARGTGRTLLHTGPYGQLADCLGDVVAASITRPQHDKNVAVLGVGVLSPKAADSAAHEVVCAVPESGAKNAVRAAYNAHLTPSARNPVTNEAMSSDVSSTTVSTRGTLVRAELVLKAKTPPGLVFQGVGHGLPPYWDGTCSATDVARRRC